MEDTFVFWAWLATVITSTVACCVLVTSILLRRHEALIRNVPFLSSTALVLSESLYVLEALGRQSDLHVVDLTLFSATFFCTAGFVLLTLLSGLWPEIARGIRGRLFLAIAQ